MSKKPQGKVGHGHETDPDTLVKIELDSINDKPFYGQVSDDELLYIWVGVFERQKEELFGITSTKSLTRNVRATYKLNEPFNLRSLKGPVFKYEKYLDDGTVEVISGKIISYDTVKPAVLGEPTKITVKTNFGVEPTGVLNWLKLYGTVAPQYGFRNKTNAAGISLGLKTDVFETEIALNKHIEEFLPMYGQKVQVYYAGIPRQCNRCYVVGHLRKECNNKKIDWIEYVQRLVASGVDISLIGNWTKAIDRWKNANSQK